MPKEIVREMSPQAQTLLGYEIAPPFLGMVTASHPAKALEPGWVTARQIEAGRVAITRHAKRGGKIWVRVFPDKPFTKKPLETRMGHGKGNPEGWVAVIKPGRVMFELAGVPEPLAKEALPPSVWMYTLIVCDSPGQVPRSYQHRSTANSHPACAVLPPGSWH